MLRERNIFSLYPDRARPFPCNQRPGAVSHPPFHLLSPLPVPRFARNTAFNRSLVYRGTLTLHLLIASVMAFLGFDANLLGRPCDFGKSSREYLISHTPVTLSRGTRTRTHARTHASAWTNGHINVDPLVVPAIQKSSDIFNNLCGNYVEREKERLVLPQG